MSAHNSYKTPLLGSGPPPAVENGRPDKQLTVTATGVSAFYTCNFNYVLVGGQSAVCQSDGTWADPPRCLRGKRQQQNYL